MQKNSFVFYHDYKETLEMLSDEELGKLMRGIFEYEITGKIPALERNIKIAFSFIKTNLDRDRKKYEETCKKNKANGQSGGRPVKETKRFK